MYTLATYLSKNKVSLIELKKNDCNNLVFRDAKYTKLPRLEICPNVADFERILLISDAHPGVRVRTEY